MTITVLAVPLQAAAVVATPGHTAWVARFKAPGDGADAIAVSPDGTRVFVTGSRSGSEAGFVTVAYDAGTGTELWSGRYHGPGTFGAADAIAVSPDGTRVYVTGDVHRPSTGDDYATIAYDAASGARRWSRLYDGPQSGDDVARALGVSPDGTRVYVTGSSPGATVNTDATTIAYDTAAGHRIWVRRYEKDGGSAVGYTLGVSPDGTRVYVGGSSATAATGWDDLTLAYDGSGIRLWARRYNGPGNADDSASALGVGPDGTRVFVTGPSQGSASTGLDYATIGYDAATGTTLWVRRYDGPAHLFDYANALGVSPDGTRVYVTGQSYGSTISWDYKTIAYDAISGVKLWGRRYDGPGNADDYANALGVSPDGTQVYVTGSSVGTTSTSLDYATIAYRAGSGDKLWTRRYTGTARPRADGAAALAVSRDGARVYVTGASFRSESSNPWAYATVAYRTR